MRRPSWIALATIAYCAWMSSGLLQVWQTSPLDRNGWIPFIIWLIPASRWTTFLTRGQKAGICAAIAVTLFGVLASVNTIKLLGLALAIGSLVSWSWRSAVWVSSCVSWIPTLGWEIAHLFPGTSTWSMLLIRTLIALLGVSVMWKKNEGE